TISAMLRAGIGKYPLIFAYLGAGFLTTAIEIYPSFTYHGSGPGNRAYVRLYWTDEGIREVLIFSVVFSLIYNATARLGLRRVMRVAVFVGGLLFVTISFFIHYSPELRLGVWMTPWTRDLKFCAAILDLALWAMLLASEEPDQRLLLLSGAMGIMFTGE